MFPYLKLLVRQRLAAWNPVSHLRGEKSTAKTVLTYIGFAVGVLSLYAMLVGLEYLLFTAFANLGEPETMLAFTGVLCTLMTVITSFFYILNELFFSKDVIFVSALPISSRQLLTAKLIRIWLGEACIALAICAPVVILYGIGASAGILFYIRALLLIPFMPLVPIAIVTLLSFLLIRISALWKRREALTVIFSMAFLMGFMWLNMSFSMSAQDDMNAMILQLVLRQRQVLSLIAGLYPPVQWFVAGLIGNGFGAFAQGLGFAALNTIAVAAVILALGGAYQRLAVKQDETLTRLNASVRKRADRHGMRTPLAALYRRELREIFIVPIYAMNCLASGVMFPLIAAVMLVSARGGNSELSMLPIVLAMLPKSLIMAIATALFAFTTSMNMAISTSVSREGKRHEFFRTLPVPPQTQLLAKLLMGLSINVITAAPMAIVAVIALPVFLPQIAAGFVISMAFTLATTILALMIDANHPKFLWKSETEAIKQNGIAAASMFGIIGFVALCGAAFYGLTVLGMSYTNALLLLFALAVVADVFLYRRLMRSTARHYILQEVRN